MRIIAVLCLALLAACASREERIADAKAACAEYGYERGTDAHSRCVQKRVEGDDDGGGTTHCVRYGTYHQFITCH